MDLKNGSGSCGTGNPESKPDVTFSLNDDVFHQMFQGKSFKPRFIFLKFFCNNIARRNFEAYDGLHERENEA